MKTLDELKTYLKDKAQEIKKMKSIRKPKNRGAGDNYSNWQLQVMKSDYRHHHIAYCMLRGRSYEQIEKKTNSAPNFERIKKIMKPIDQERHRLYVVVRTDLPPIHQAVQAGHGVAQFLIDNRNTAWNNGTLVYLQARDEEDLMILLSELKVKGLELSSFAEPDRGNKVTTVCCATDRKELFKDRETLAL